MPATITHTLPCRFRDSLAPSSGRFRSKRPRDVRRSGFRWWRAMALGLAPILLLASTATAESVSLEELMPELRALRQLVEGQQREIDPLKQPREARPQASADAPPQES